MDLNVYDLNSAIKHEIYENSNGEEDYVSKENLDYLISNNFFPHLEYFFTQKSFQKIENYSHFYKNQLIKKLNSKNYTINLSNKILVNISESIKRKEDFPNLLKSLEKREIQLEGVLDIEFFEKYKIQEDYLNYILKEHEIKEREDDGVYRFPTIEDVINHIENLETNHFEDVFFNEDPSNLYDIIIEEDKRIDDSKFTSFLDTEKIHIQMPIISKGNKKNIPVLGYFGFGNYYPFTGTIKNKNLRFNRFSQLNANDYIDVKYYESQMNLSSDKRKINLIKLIDESQLKYMKFFKENFSLKKRKKVYESKYGKTSYSTFIEELIMLDPIIRTKSTSLISYFYFKNEFNFNKQEI